MLDFQQEYFGLPLICWLCIIAVLGYIVYAYFSLQKKGLENFGQCGGVKVKRKKLKPLLRPNKKTRKIKLTCFYSNRCHFSKVFMGPLIKGSTFKGEWKDIKEYCKKNGIKAESKECDNNHLNRSLSASMGVPGFPTCVLTIEEEVIHKFVGAKQAPDFIAELEQVKNGEVKKPEKAKVNVPSSGLAIKTYYADWCYYSKLLMGHKIIPGAVDKDGKPIPGEWDAINAFCKKNNIDCQYVETSSGAGKEEAISLGINGFPTTKLYKDGKEMGEIGGFMEAPNFINKLKSM